MEEEENAHEIAVCVREVESPDRKSQRGGVWRRLAVPFEKLIVCKVATFEITTERAVRASVAAAWAVGRRGLFVKRRLECFVVLEPCELVDWRRVGR